MAVSKQEALALAEQWQREGFAVWWTDAKKGDGAKQCKSSWNTKAQLISGMELENAAGMIAQRLARKNPVLVAKASGMSLIDCDSAEDVASFKSFLPPRTRSVATSQGRHFYYRPDAGDPPGGIYFEGGAITFKSDCYLVMPPAIHPSGREYVYENENEIVVLPSAVRGRMLEAAGVQIDATDDRLADDPTAKVREPGRHDFLKRECGKLRNTGLSAEGLLAALLEINEQRCDPPKPEAEVRRMARDSRKWKGALDEMLYETEEHRAERAASRHTDHDYSDADIRVSDAESRHTPWLDKPFIQGAAFQVLAAKGSTGKGLWTAMLASQVTRGLLPGQHGERGNVAFISSEDSVSQDVKPRLQAAEADLDRCFVVTRRFRLPEDEAWLRGYVTHRGLAAVVIDPVSNHIGGVDGNDEAAIRNALDGLNAVADELNCLVLGVRHMRKDAESGALAGVLGSTAWVDLPRQVIVMVRDPDDPSVVHADVLKQNRAKMGDSGRAYQIVGRDLVLDDGVVDNIGLMGPAVDIDFRDLDSIVGRRKNSGAKEARAVIVQLLEEHGGQMISTELDAAVSARTGLKKVSGVRSEMTAGQKGKATATKDRPLLWIHPPQLSEDRKNYITELAFVEMREEIDEF